MIGADAALFGAIGFLIGWVIAKRNELLPRRRGPASGERRRMSVWQIILIVVAVLVLVTLVMSATLEGGSS